MRVHACAGVGSLPFILHYWNGTFKRYLKGGLMFLGVQSLKGIGVFIFCALFFTTQPLVRPSLAMVISLLCYQRPKATGPSDCVLNTQKLWARWVKPSLLSCSHTSHGLYDAHVHLSGSSSINSFPKNIPGVKKHLDLNLPTAQKVLSAPVLNAYWMTHKKCWISARKAPPRS